MSEMVYLLSMTHGDASLYVQDDADVIAPTSKMGWARAWETEDDAFAYKSAQNLPFQVTPIGRKRFFKAVLEVK